MPLYTGYAASDHHTMPDINDLLRQASDLFKRGEFSAARSACNAVLQQDPQHVPALNLCGSILATAGNLRESVCLFENAVSASPADFTSRRNLAQCYLNLGRFAEASAEFRQALTINARAPVVLFGLGCAELAQGLYSSAVDALTESRKLKDDYPALHLNLGKAYENLGHTDEATASYRTALSLDPQSLDANNCLGNLHLKSGDFTSAVNYLQRANELDASNTDIEINLALALDHAGRQDEAREHHLRAVRQNPASQSAYIAFDMFLLRSGGEKKQRFLEVFSNDHLYENWQEAVTMAKMLATMIDYPEPGIIDALHQFLDIYDPGGLHSPDWWRARLAEFGPAAEGHDKVLRSVHSAVFSWSLPDTDTLSTIADFAGDTILYSYGAGAGFWERLLVDHFGLNVIASDRRLRHRFLEMKAEDYSKCTVPENATVLIAWINRGDTAILNVLNQLRKGQQLVLIGEPPPRPGVQGICASPEIFRLLETEFELTRNIPLVSYSLLNDSAAFYIRK